MTANNPEPTPNSEPTPDAAVAATSAAPLTPSHGPLTSRSVVNVPRSSIETGKFGRLFRTLPPLVLDPAQIQAVVGQMTDPGDPATGGGGWSGTPTSSDSDLPSGYTYLSQFVDHDITFDPISMLDQANDPDALENFRTPRFDLDCLYGLGPVANPWLYDTTDSDKLLIGTNLDGFTTPDLSRNQQERALIGDPRNDVHVIISQLHLAFAQFHNKVVDLVRANPSLVDAVPATPVGGWGAAPTPDNPVTFGQIVTIVRWHYQWIVLKHLLPRLVGPETANAVLVDKKGRLVPDLELYSIRRKPWMPVEFSAAGYRFGHSLVRDAYLLNSGLPPLPVFSVDGDANPLGDLRGFRRLPGGWQIEWARFFDGLPASGTDTQVARGFDTKLVPSLHRLPSGIDRMNRSLASLNLTRGVALGLPSGEDVATAVASKVGLDPATVHIDTGLPHPAPLWFWILREAETKAAGRHLGPVGGRIVAEVLVGLAANDPSSFLKHQPDWRPNLPGATAGDFTMADLFTIVG